jgi:hypothetical protein
VTTADDHTPMNQDRRDDINEAVDETIEDGTVESNK